MLKLYLDEHISPDVGTSLRLRIKGLTVHWTEEWEAGRLLGVEDSLVLEALNQQELTLVTFDRRTIPAILKTWVEAGREHAGVIFVDGKTIAPNDIGGLIRSLTNLWQETGTSDWSNRIHCLKRQESA
jgi:hypothetical protein